MLSMYLIDITVRYFLYLVHGNDIEAKKEANGDPTYAGADTRIEAPFSRYREDPFRTR